MKQRKRFRQAGVLIVALITGLTLALAPAFADFAGWGATYHVGKYYFKCRHGDETGEVYVSRYHDRGFKKTPVDDPYFRTDGKEIYYIDRNGRNTQLKTYVIAKKKVKTIGKLPKAHNWELRAQKGRYLWIEKNYSHLYRYNMKAKKLSLVKKKVDFWHLSGTSYLYQYGEKECENGPDWLTSTKAGIYEPTKNGKLKLKRSLGNINGASEEMYSVVKWGKIKTLYYTTDEAHKLYRVKADGTQKKLVASFEGFVYEVDDTYCLLVEDDMHYIYTYKTGKLRVNDSL